MKALVFENKVVDVAEVPFEAHSSLTWMDCSNDCEIGWILEDGALVAPPDPPEKTYAENRRDEYPDWGTQLNKIYDDGLTKWKSEMVDPVKAKWPKDNSGPK